MIQRFLAQVRTFFLKGFPVAAQAFLSVYLLMLICLYPKSFNFCNNLILLTIVPAVALLIIYPPKEKPVWPYWMFVLSIMVFYGLNILAVDIPRKIPDMGNTSSSWKHLPELLLALLTGLSIRSRGAAGRLLAVLLAVAGAWYLYELVSIPGRPVWLDNRYMASRGFHTILAMELLQLFALFFCSMLLLTKRWQVIATLLGSVLIGVLLFLTHTRLTLLTMIFVTIPVVFVIQNRWGSLRQRLACAFIWFILIAPAVSLVWYSNASPVRKSKATIELRMTAWKITCQIARKEPWGRKMIGNGRFSHTFDAMADYYGTNKTALLGKEFHHCHNVILQTFLETGIIGVAALICIWVSAFYRACRAWFFEKEPKLVSGVMVAALITIATMSLMDYSLQEVSGFLAFFLTGLAFASGADNEIKDQTAGLQA